MTEVEFKKKLIADLEDLYDYLREEYKLHPDKIIFENYDSVLSNAWFTIEDTLPRVLTVEEVKNKKEGEALYIEFRRSYGSRYCCISDYDPHNYIYVYVRYFGIDEDEYFEFASYNKTWRIWNIEPTAEQMKETPWDCD